MPLSSTTKTAINAKIKTLMGDLTAKDYLANKAVLKTVLTKLHDSAAYGGWIIEANNPDWSLATEVKLRRTYKILITRSPEHQAMVEKNGEVAIGDNTYQSIRTEILNGSVDKRTGPKGDPKMETVAGIKETLGMLIIEALNKGPRPADRIGDLT